MSRTLSQQAVVLTGGASGIGRAAVEAFVRAGARVVLGDRDAQAGAACVEALRGAPGEVTFLPVDVADSDALKAFVADAVVHLGRLDVLVNNAGVGGAMVGLAEYPEDDWHRVLAVNLTAVFVGMKQALPHLMQTRGAIVNVASVAGLRGFAGHAAYTAAKHGVVGLTRTAALEYARHGVRVNAVCPGFTRTPMIAPLVAAGEEPLTRHVPMRRLGTADEVAAAIVYLCAPEAAFITGQTLALDGGVTAA